MMKKSLRVVSIALLAVLFMNFNHSSPVFGQGGEGKEITLKGAIVDAHCYLRYGAKASKENAECFNECIDKGVPPGFLSEDGQFYLLLSEKKHSLKDKVAGMASIPVDLTGIAAERSGFKAILLKNVERVEQAENSDLGVVRFDNSGSKEAQPHFIRGLAWLHSFWYDKAAGLFRKAQEVDPNFAMAYWGEAMCHNAPIWGNQDADKAREILNRLGATPEARLEKAKMPKEKALLRAVEALYGKGDKSSRDIAYSEAMRKAYEQYPDDPEIAAFYSLSLQGRMQRGKQDTRTQMKSAAVAQQVFSKHPDHPGAAHYLIHAVDDPIHAPLGLEAARSYARIAPASEHALHMPSHIFLVLGMWDDSVSSDESAHAAEDAMVERGEITLAQHSFHSLHWLSYTYPQQGRFKKAKETVAIIKENEKKSPDKHTQAMSGLIEAIYTIQTRDWKKMEPPEKTDGAGFYGEVEAAQNLAAGMSAVHLGDMATATGAMRRLKELKELNESKGDTFRAKYMNIMENEIAALMRKSKGDVDECLRLLKIASEIEAQMDYPKIPRSIKPAPELYGEILLELKKPEEAAMQFQICLSLMPNRSASVLGLARAAALMGDTEKAYEYYRQFLKNWRDADPNLPESKEARKFLERHKGIEATAKSAVSVISTHPSIGKQKAHTGCKH